MSFEWSYFKVIAVTQRHRSAERKTVFLPHPWFSVYGWGDVQWLISGTTFVEDSSLLLNTPIRQHPTARNFNTRKTSSLNLQGNLYSGAHTYTPTHTHTK